MVSSEALLMDTDSTYKIVPDISLPGVTWIPTITFVEVICVKVCGSTIVFVPGIIVVYALATKFLYVLVVTTLGGNSVPSPQEPLTIMGVLINPRVFIA